MSVVTFCVRILRDFPPPTDTDIVHCMECILILCLRLSLLVRNDFEKYIAIFLSRARCLLHSSLCLFVSFVHFCFCFFHIYFSLHLAHCVVVTRTLHRHTDTCIVYVVLSQLQSMWKLFMKNEMKTKKNRKKFGMQS